MELEASGHYRRTQAERDDQLLSWRRADRAFFAAGACHILAWVCRETYPDQPIGLAGIRRADGAQVFHAYATWNGWAFEHSGWHAESDLISVNQTFEGCPIERIDIGTDLPEFCQRHYSRMPHQYYADPRPRAREYLAQFDPPWS